MGSERGFSLGGRTARAGVSGNQSLVDAIDGVAAATPSAIRNDFFVVEERESHGTEATITPGASQNWYQRPLSTVTAESVTGVIGTPDSNGTFTLQPGTYRFAANAQVRVAESNNPQIHSRVVLECIGQDTSTNKRVIGGNYTAKSFDNNDAAAAVPALIGRLELTGEVWDVKLHIFVADGVTPDIGLSSPGTISFGQNQSMFDDDGDADSIDITGTEILETYAQVTIWRESIATVAAADPSATAAEDRFADFSECQPLKTKSVGPLLPPLIVEPVERREITARVVGQARGYVLGQNESFDWPGVETSVSPTGLSDRQFTDALNVDTIGHAGTLTPRKGLVRMQVKGTSQVTGVSIADLGLRNEDGSRTFLLLAGDDSGSSLLDQAAYETVVIPPCFPPNFIPNVTLTSSSSKITVAIPAIDSISGIEAVRVAADLVAYPSSIFDDADRKSSLDEDITWDGEAALSSSTSSIALAPTSVYFVTVWLKTPLGYSDPFKGQVTIVA